MSDPEFPVSFEDIVKGASTGGWDWFKNVDPQVRQAVEIKKANAAAEQRAIDVAWAQFAATAGGRKALDQLFDSTLRRTVFFAQLGLPLDQMAVFGALREGQNALAQEIARHIAAGRGSTTRKPKPRDNR